MILEGTIYLIISIAKLDNQYAYSDTPDTYYKCFTCSFYSLTVNVIKEAGINERPIVNKKEAATPFAAISKSLTSYVNFKGAIYNVILISFLPVLYLIIS